jgi:aspartate kinase
MKLAVQKYGGTSLANADRLKHVARHIKASLQTFDRLVVVASAMGRFTDEWIELAHSISSNPPQREMDMLLSVGERVSSALLCMALHEVGVTAVSLTGSQCGILTTPEHGNAKIIGIRGDRVPKAFETNSVVVIAGFQGVSQDTKDVTTLGRGGSDLTAIAMGIALKANTCQIFTDVPGVMTNDPDVDPDAKLIPELEWAEMTRMAYNGAGVMHPRACRLAQIYHRTFEVRSSFTPNIAGTLITGTSSLWDHPVSELEGSTVDLA